MSVPTTTIQQRLDLAFTPPTYGGARVEGIIEDDFFGDDRNTITWHASATNNPDLYVESWITHSPGGGFRSRPWEGVAWIAYVIDALPPESFGLEVGLLANIWPYIGDLSDIWPVDKHSLDINPDAAIVFTGIPFQDYTYPESDEPNEAMQVLLGEHATTEPEWGRVRFDQFTFDESGWTEDVQQIMVDFPGMGQAMRDAAAEIGLPMMLTLRVWIDPPPFNMNRILLYDDGDGNSEEHAWLGATFEGHPTDGPLRLPQLVLTMTCPEPEEPEPIAPIAVGTPAGIPRDRLPAESIRRLAPTLADPRIHIPARLKRHSRRRVKR